MKRNDDFQTKCVHAGENYEDYHGGVTPPIFENSLFTFPDYQTAADAFAGKNDRYVYTRGKNPTVEVLERKISELELTEAARIFSSGMAAITSAVLTNLKSGDHLIAVNNCYSPAYKFFVGYLKERFNVEVTFVAGDTASFKEAIRPNTRVIYLESPTSITFKLQDLRAVAELAKERGVTTIIDNSYSSPYNQNPSQLGIDLVVHSVSKYINGHSDVVAGVVTGRKELIEKIGENEQATYGGIIGPFEAWLILRGIRTLGVRMKTHNENGLRIANFLENHSAIKRVNYPGLESHPQHDLYLQQMRGAGGLMSFELDPSLSPEVLIDSLKLFSTAVSWGGYESLILHSSVPLKNSLPGEVREEWGITDNLIRLYIGLENYEALKADLKTGLAKL